MSTGISFQEHGEQTLILSSLEMSSCLCGALQACQCEACWPVRPTTGTHYKSPAYSSLLFLQALAFHLEMPLAGYFLKAKLLFLSFLHHNDPSTPDNTVQGKLMFPPTQNGHRAVSAL